MRIALDPADLSPKALEAAFHFRPPEAFRAILEVVAAHSAGSAPLFGRLFHDLFGHMLAGPANRYGNSPAELFVTGATGIDGMHLGFVDHAPELARDDLPLAAFEIWEGKVTYLGADTMEAFGWLMSHDHTAERPADVGWEAAPSDLLSRARRDLEMLGLTGPADGAKPPAAPGNLAMPPGWQFRDTWDDVGIWGPQDGWLDDPWRISRNASLDELIAYADGLAERGGPFDALNLIKNVYVELWSDPEPNRTRLMTAFSQAYLRVGRGELARNLNLYGTEEPDYEEPYNMELHSPVPPAFLGDAPQGLPQ